MIRPRGVFLPLALARAASLSRAEAVNARVGMMLVSIRVTAKAMSFGASHEL